MWCRVILVFGLAVSDASASLACTHPEFCADVPALVTLPASAVNAYREGNYVLAATIAETKGTAEALAFAARARNADAITRDGGLCLQCLSKAEQAATAAIAAGTSRPHGLEQPDWFALKPALAQGYVQLAIAIGLRGRLLGASEAQAEGLADKGRAAIDRALELDPQNNWALASLGSWHLEIVRRAGPVLASVMYGASEREGLENVRTALARDANNLLLAYNLALSLLALDSDRYRTEASKMLSSGGSDATRDALTSFTRKRADQLVELLKAGTSAEIEALVRKFQGYPPES